MAKGPTVLSYFIGLLVMLLGLAPIVYTAYKKFWRHRGITLPD